MKILAIQNRMGIGDTVIFLPFIKALSKKYNSPISLLVKESSKADQYLSETNYIDKIIILERDQKDNDRHGGFWGSLNLIKDLRSHNFDKIFIFNSSLRFNLIAKFSKITEIYQYPLFNKHKQHIVNTPKKFMKDKINIDFFDDPEIHIDNDSVKNASKKFLIDKEDTNILLGIGGSGPTKRIPAYIFLKFMSELIKKKRCKFFLATGKNIDEQKILNEILKSELKNFCIPLDNLSIKEILPIIKNCDISVCNDTSFSHLSAALGIETITLMADTPLIYGNYSSKMKPIIPDGETHVSHNTKGKDRINPEKILSKIIEIIN
tara:strand:- start:2710 stop:3672 length:963 start_codon:yes stop_codon:yes gene_type:complete